MLTCRSRGRSRRGRRAPRSTPASTPGPSPSWVGGWVAGWVCGWGRLCAGGGGTVPLVPARCPSRACVAAATSCPPPCGAGADASVVRRTMAGLVRQGEPAANVAVSLTLPSRFYMTLCARCTRLAAPRPPRAPPPPHSHPTPPHPSTGTHSPTLPHPTHPPMRHTQLPALRRRLCLAGPAPLGPLPAAALPRRVQARVRCSFVGPRHWAPGQPA